MGRVRSVVAVVAVSVVVGGAVATIATTRGGPPLDVSRHVSRGVDITDTDEPPPYGSVAARRIETENLMIQGGEPYTQEDVDRELAELLEAERLFPQEMRPEGEPVEDTGDNEFTDTIIIDDGR